MVIFYMGACNELSIPLNEVQKFERETHLVERNAHLRSPSGIFSQYKVYPEAWGHLIGC